jgi:hypothetical protein
MAVHAPGGDNGTNGAHIALAPLWPVFVGDPGKKLSVTMMTLQTWSDITHLYDK